MITANNRECNELTIECNIHLYTFMLFTESEMCAMCAYYMNYSAFHFYLCNLIVVKNARKIHLPRIGMRKECRANFWYFTFIFFFRFYYHISFVHIYDGPFDFTILKWWSHITPHTHPHTHGDNSFCPFTNSQMKEKWFFFFFFAMSKRFVHHATSFSSTLI